MSLATIAHTRADAKGKTIEELREMLVKAERGWKEAEKKWGGEGLDYTRPIHKAWTRVKELKKIIEERGDKSSGR